MPDHPVIPVSVIIVTKGEGASLSPTLAALASFDQIIVVDSGGDADTFAVAQSFGADTVAYTWDGAYPKKRQWCLDHVSLAHDWVFFVDADEIVTPELTRAIVDLFAHDGPCADGYFVRGRYVWGGRVLRFGLTNNKLALFNRHVFMFPVVDDLGLPGMGEIEGHYQPVAKKPGARIGVLAPMLTHDAASDPAHWYERHERYAHWEAGMNARGAWPADPVAWRHCLKRVFRALPVRGVVAFLYCYVWKGGFLDGRAGFDFARARAWYYHRIAALSRRALIAQ